MLPSFLEEHISQIPALQLLQQLGDEIDMILEKCLDVARRRYAT